MSIVNNRHPGWNGKIRHGGTAICVNREHMDVGVEKRKSNGNCIKASPLDRDSEPRSIEGRDIQTSLNGHQIDYIQLYRNIQQIYVCLRIFAVISDRMSIVSLFKANKRASGHSHSEYRFYYCCVCLI